MTRDLVQRGRRAGGSGSKEGREKEKREEEESTKSYCHSGRLRNQECMTELQLNFTDWYCPDHVCISVCTLVLEHQSVSPRHRLCVCVFACLVLGMSLHLIFILFSRVKRTCGCSPVCLTPAACFTSPAGKVFTQNANHFSVAPSVIEGTQLL